MKANIKYFGMIAEKIGKTEETVDIEFNEQLNLRDYFIKKYPELIEMNYQIAVDKKLTETINSNSESAEIALLPPFAGG